MLKNKLFNIVKSSTKFVEGFRGEVEVKAWRNGELFYHDGGSNTVTIWSRHANIHLLSGMQYSLDGNTISPAPGGETHDTRFTCRPAASGDHTAAINMDGYLISGEQYFWDYATFTTNCLNPVVPHNGQEIYPFFPTKMLFGTGREYTNWTGGVAGDDRPVPAEFQSVLSAPPPDGYDYTQASFDALISSRHNYYSNIRPTSDPTTLKNARTVNDIYNGPLTEASVPIAAFESDYGVDGAIKNSGIYQASNSTTLLNLLDTTDTEAWDAGNKVIKPRYRGVGYPAFIYCKRKIGSSEIAVIPDDAKDFNNRITFTVVMPEQTIVDPIGFYPYNDWTIKEAGLFCDSRLVRKTESGNPPSPGEDGYAQYNCMPNGIMMAKRKITPITKTADVKISVTWSLFL